MIAGLPPYTRKENAMEPSLLDTAGHHRSPVTMPGYHHGRPPRNKGRRYPADPPTIDEIIAVMRAAGPGKNAARLRALIVLLWRAGLRISEALDLAESDLDREHGGILIRRGKGGKGREVGMDGRAWQQRRLAQGERAHESRSHALHDNHPTDCIPKIPPYDLTFIGRSTRKRLALLAAHLPT